MNILIASSEAVPFVKTGGLGDVIGSLISQFEKTGIRAATILPLHRIIKKSAVKWGIKSLNTEISVPLGDNMEKGRLWTCRTPDSGVFYFIENDRFFDKDDLYSTAEGEYNDNAVRFTFFCRGVLETIIKLDLQTDVIHCNDWHTGLIPVYLKTIYRNTLPKTSSVLSIHNLGYQGIFDSSVMSVSGLEHGLLSSGELDFHGRFNFLKTGIVFADTINTVSGNYAREILTREYGFGLDDVLVKRQKDIYGILNGLDYKSWNPEIDTSLPANFSANDLSGKALCKKTLQNISGLSHDNSMLIGIVSRLSSQKGLDLAAEVMDKIIDSGIQMVILGKGEKYYQDIFLGLERKYSSRLSVTIGFDDILARRVYAGSDVFLMPSQYEPCGLGQLIAMRYGTIPVVRKTGGLIDTVSEYSPSDSKGTGFLFSDYASDELLTAIKKANRLYGDKQHWRVIQKNAMSRDFSWPRSAEKYLALYKTTIEKMN